MKSFLVFLFVAGGTLFLSSCFLRPAPPGQGSFAVSQEGKEQVLARARTLLAQERFSEVLTLLGPSLSREKSPSIMAAWQAGIRGLLAAGDRCREQGELGRAGQFYRQTLNHYLAGVQGSRLADLPPEDISRRLDQCTARLMEEGLAAYRRGDFEQAIGHWQNILSFDEKNAAALQAVNTTRTQLENLNALPRPSSLP